MGGSRWEALLMAAKSGEIAASDVDAAAAILLSGEADNRYTLLHIVAAAALPQHVPLVEGFLHSPDDPMLARLALQQLTGRCGPAEKYLPQLLEFAAGVDWDTHDDVRPIAISALGQYARETGDIHVLATLLEVMDTASDDLVRDDAYCAIARAMGREWSSIPSAARRMDWSVDADMTLLREARARAGMSVVVPFDDPVSRVLRKS